jgi:hypothetical protein
MTAPARRARLCVPAALALATFAGGGIASAHAQANPLSREQLIQEAFRGELVYVQDAKEFQLTLASDVTSDRLLAPGTISLGAEYGITSAWQVGVEWQAPTSRQVDAATSMLTVGIKRAWMQIHGSPVHFAAGADLSMSPFSMAGTNSTEVESFAVLAADAAHGNVHAYVGASFGVRPVNSDDIGDEASGLELHAGVVSRIGQFRFVTELDRQRHGELCLTPGIVWRGSSSLQLGIAAPVGLTALGDRPQLIAKVTYEFHLDS